MYPLKSNTTIPATSRGHDIVERTGIARTTEHTPYYDIHVRAVVLALPVGLTISCAEFLWYLVKMP